MPLQLVHAKNARHEASHVRKGPPTAMAAAAADEIPSASEADVILETR